MSPQRRLSRQAAFWPLLLVAIVLCAHFGDVVLGRNVYYGGDIARQYLPQWAELSKALRRGELPWWSSRMGIGYPLLAEGEVGAWYPINWLLLSLCPLAASINLFVLSHYLIAGAGFFAFLRSMCRSRTAALFGALVLTLGGFYRAHLGHLGILAVAAWLPWLFYVTHRLFTARDPRASRRAALYFAPLVALQFLAGHAQIALVNMFALVAYAAILALRLWRRESDEGCAGSPWLVPALWLGGALFGVLLAAPQLLPSVELARHSVRSGGLSGRMFISYSFHPTLFATFFSPFVYGNPYPAGSVEVMGYVGLLPLALVGVALRGHRRGEAGFFLGLLLTGLGLALGGWNPLYHALRYVPVLNLFRVPARYLLWVDLSLAVLAATGLDTLLSPIPSHSVGSGWVAAALLLAGAGGASIAVAGSGTADALVALWRWLPLLWSALCVLWMASTHRLGRRLWLLGAFALLLADLYAFGAVLGKTYNTVWPAETVVDPPAIVEFLQQDDTLYRIYVKEEILPALSVQRESLYPNMALAHGVASANLYVPLIPSAYDNALGELTAQRLNHLNVRYYVVPQLLPVDEASELYDVENPFAALPYSRWIEVPDLSLEALEMESYLSHSAHLTDGTLAAEILVRTAEGVVLTFPVRVGFETAEWAYERDDVREHIAHSLPPLAGSFPARSGFPPSEHVGHTYLGQWVLPGSLMGKIRVTGVLIRPILPEAFVRVERMRLVAGQQTHLLSHVAGLGDHTIVFRSEDALIYRNEDALPRAYWVPESRMNTRSAGLELPKDLTLLDVQPVRVAIYTDHEVELDTASETPGYVVLADLYYPGWRATVDGNDAEILPVDDILRAVWLPEGAHRVRFVYCPGSRLIPSFCSPAGSCRH